MTVALLGLAEAALASPVPAGSVIESTAEATYLDNGVSRTATSNTVQVRVDEVLGVAAATLNAGPLSVRSGPQVLSFLVNNTGNGPEAVSLERVTSVPGNAFDTALETIAIDSNDNGVYDPGVDAVLSGPSVTGAIAAGGTERVLVIVLVPSGIADGARSEITLIARTVTGTGVPGTIFAGAGEAGTDAVVDAGGGQASATGQMVGVASSVTLDKWARVTDPFGGSTPLPGATITYGIRLHANGSTSIDGALIADAIPQGTSYVANSLTLEGATLTDAVGDDAGEATATGISVILGTVPAGALRTVTFDVLIEK